MEPITQYIAAHWVAWLFAAISGILATAYHRLAGRLKNGANKDTSYQCCSPCLTS